MIVVQLGGGAVSAEERREFVRERREHAARKHRPDQIDLLLVAEAPPAADDRYFYFDDVATNDWIFSGVVEVVLERKPTRGPKGPTLQELKSRGVFLIDLKADPVGGSNLGECVDDLVARCLSLKPRRVVLIKATVFDLAYRALLNAGVPVVNARLPFPSHGHQAIFRRQFAAALRDDVPLQSPAGNWGSLIEERLKALGEFLGVSQWFGRENELVNLFAHSFLALKPIDAAQIGIEVAVKQLQRIGGKELVRKDLVLWREPRMNVWVDRVPANDPVVTIYGSVPGMWSG